MNRGYGYLSDLQQLIEQIHATDVTFELVITGGGSSALSQLLAVSGASNSLLNGVIPYSASALAQYLNHHPLSSCSEKTARLIAVTAFNNARSMHHGAVMGVGATAAMQTNRTRRGSDRIHLAIQTLDSLTTYYLDLGNEPRSEQEAACASLIVKSIALHSGINGTDATNDATRDVKAPASWQELLHGNERYASDKHPLAIMPGAFNPPHEGHFLMREIAEQKLGTEVSFELSIENVDKPTLDYFDMDDRQQLLADHPVVFTRAATFIEKAKLFPGAAFVVGMDTLVRIDDKKYYNNSEQDKQRALVQIADAGHKFLVFGRFADGQFLSLDDVQLTSELRDICIEVPESEFRVDLSSTELRKA